MTIDQEDCLSVVVSINNWQAAQTETADRCSRLIEMGAELDQHTSTRVLSDVRKFFKGEVGKMPGVVFHILANGIEFQSLFPILGEVPVLGEGKRVSV